MARNLRSADKSTQRTPSAEPRPIRRVTRSSSQQPFLQTAKNDPPAASNTGKVRKRGSSVSSTKSNKSAPSTPRGKRKQPKKGAKKDVAAHAPSPIQEDEHESEELVTNTADTSVHDDIKVEEAEANEVIAAPKTQTSAEPLQEVTLLSIQEQFEEPDPDELAVSHVHTATELSQYLTAPDIQEQHITRTVNETVTTHVSDVIDISDDEPLNAAPHSTFANQVIDLTDEEPSTSPDEALASTQQHLSSNVNDTQHDTQEVAGVVIPSHEFATAGPAEELVGSETTDDDHQSDSEQEQGVVHQSIEHPIDDGSVTAKDTEAEDTEAEDTEAEHTYIQPSKATEQDPSDFPHSISAASFLSRTALATSSFIRDSYVQGKLPDALPTGLARWFALTEPYGYASPHARFRSSETMWAIAKDMTDYERTALLVEQFGRIKDLEDSNRQHLQAKRSHLSHVRHLEQEADDAKFDAIKAERSFQNSEFVKGIKERDASLKRKREAEELELSKRQRTERAALAAESKRMAITARISAKDIIIEGCKSQKEVDFIAKLLVSKAHGDYPDHVMQLYRNVLNTMSFADLWELDGIHIDFKWGRWPYTREVLEQAREENRRKGRPVELPPKDFGKAADADLSTIEEGDEDTTIARTTPGRSNHENDNNRTMFGGIQSSPFEENVPEHFSPSGWTGSLRNVIGSVRKYIPTFSRTPKTAPVRRSRPMVPRTPLANIHDSAKVPQRQFTFASPASPSVGRGRRSIRAGCMSETESETARNTLANRGTPRPGRWPSDSPPPDTSPDQSYQASQPSHLDYAPRLFRPATTPQAEAPRATEMSALDARVVNANTPTAPDTPMTDGASEAPRTAPANRVSSTGGTFDQARSAPPRRRTLGPPRTVRASEEHVGEPDQYRSFKTFREARAAERARVEGERRKTAEEDEDCRRVREAREKAKAAERAARTGEKRQRKVNVRAGDLKRPNKGPSPARSFGMTDDFWSDEDSDDEILELNDDDILLPQTPSRKRVRFNDGPEAQFEREIINRSVPPTTPGQTQSVALGDSKKPAPYMGTMFASPQDADSSANVFMKQKAIQDKNAQLSDSELSPHSYGQKYGVWIGPKEKVVRSSNTFSVPDSSDSDSDGETDGGQASTQTTPAAADRLSQEPTTTSRSTSNIFAKAISPNGDSAQHQQPSFQPLTPATPKITHASLPSGHDTSEALTRAREQANKYKPKTPSGLRTADKIASSPHGSAPPTPPPQKRTEATSDELDLPADHAYHPDRFDWGTLPRLPTPTPSEQEVIDEYERTTSQEEKDQFANEMWATAWSKYCNEHPEQDRNFGDLSWLTEQKEIRDREEAENAARGQAVVEEEL